MTKLLLSPGFADGWLKLSWAGLGCMGKIDRQSCLCHSSATDASPVSSQDQDSRQKMVGATPLRLVGKLRWGESSRVSRMW
jgi:hypothetical protein